MYYVKYTIIFVLAVFLTVGCTQQEKTFREPVPIEKEEPTAVPQLEEDYTNVKEGEVLSSEKASLKIGEALPVSRALAAKMIGLCQFSQSEIDALDTEISFTDVSKEDWFYPYVNCVYVSGFMKGEGSEFYPLKPLTLYEAQVLLDTINKSNRTKIKLTEETKNSPISYALWTELFQKAVTQAAGAKTLSEAGQMAEKELYIFATPANSSLSSWQVATDSGIYNFSGYALDAYIDQKVKALVKDGIIVCMIEVTEEYPVLYSAYCENWTTEQVSVFFSGARRQIEIPQDSTITRALIGDMKIENGKLKEFSPDGEMIAGVVKKVGNGVLELENSGKYTLTPGFQVYYQNEDTVTTAPISGLICGADIADYYQKNGEISAAVIRRTVNPDRIRVVLSNDSGGYLHDTVKITSNTEFTCLQNGEKKTYQAGEIVEIASDGSGQRDAFQSQGKLTVLTTARGNENGGYRGTLEVERSNEGCIIVNELALEEYLYSVIPSEMPSSYGLEAAKVQAVTARSYAVNQFFANRYHVYGANVDDSTLCQVYNAYGENDTSIKAADDTKGLCLTYQGEIVSANFFSTACGVRANSGEVWAAQGGKEFPSQTLPYLSYQKDYTGKDRGNLSEEQTAKAFFKASDIDCFDSDSSWFRWHVKLSEYELSAVINSNLKKVYERNPVLVKTKQPDNTFRSRPIETVGEILDVTVEKRGEGGNVMEIVIRGTKAEILVKTEYNIRTLLAPVQKIEGAPPIVLTCYNGKEYKNYSLLPSAFFILQKDTDEKGEIRNLIIFGGGNGHGVGMSQNGVKGMVDRGYTYQEILNYYYPNTEIKTYSD